MLAAYAAWVTATTWALRGRVERRHQTRPLARAWARAREDDSEQVVARCECGRTLPVHEESLADDPIRYGVCGAVFQPPSGPARALPPALGAPPG